MYRPHARAEFVAALIHVGGSVVNSSGFASRSLAETCTDLFGAEHDTASVSGLLRAMEKDGQVRRKMNGRRTMRISLASTCDQLTLGSAIALLLELGNDPGVVDMLVRRAGLKPPTLSPSRPAAPEPSGDDRGKALIERLHETRRQLAERDERIAELERVVAELSAKLERSEEDLAVARADVATLEEDLQRAWAAQDRQVSA